MPITYLTPEEVARYHRVHINTVYARIREDEYEGMLRVGRQYRIPASAIGLSNEEARAVIASLSEGSERSQTARAA